MESVHEKTTLVLCEINKNFIFFVQIAQEKFSIYYICGEKSYKSITFCVKKLLEKKTLRWYDIIGMIIGFGGTVPILPVFEFGRRTTFECLSLTDLFILQKIQFGTDKRRYGIYEAYEKNDFGLDSS